MNKVGYPDRPVSNLNEDLFNVETYINGLCEFIKNCDTPMTISIQGDWGSGKTSMMNMVRDKLQGQVWPVWFNTWQFSQFDMGNSLVFSMMTILLDNLGYGQDNIKKVLGGFAKLAKNAAMVATNMTLGSYAAGKVESMLDPEETVDYASEVTELREKFQNAVNQKIQKENRERVVIFVDDLDRLQPSRAVELLEVLKVFLDCKNCVFVLAVDYEVVTLGIKQKFGNNVSEEKGRSFFDKIIQLPFKMPVAQYDIRKYVQDALSHMGIDNGADNCELYVSLIQASIGFNPRSMKRLFNTFQLLDIISKSTIQGIDDSVRQRVLFAIVCMQTKFEGLYRYFATLPGNLDGETLDVFVSEDAAERINEKEEFAAVVDGDNDAEVYLKKIRQFMKLFIQAIQLDDDMAVSKEEAGVLEKILRCSMVTSVVNAEENTESDIEKEYRKEGRQIAREVKELLCEYGEVKIWHPRYKGARYSDVGSHLVFRSKYGFNFSVSYYLSRENDHELAVNIKVQDESRDAARFMEILRENPMPVFGVQAIRHKWGAYEYSRAAFFPIDDNTSGKIADLWIKAYQEMKKQLID